MTEYVDSELLLQPLLFGVQDRLRAGDAGVVDQDGR